MKILDLYCCQGGAGMGYKLAGATHVEGVDKDPQPRYPLLFTQGDALEYVREYGHLFDFIHASPPCQFDSDTARLNDRTHPDLIDPTREALESTGVPWVIENVGGAREKLRNPVMLCGAFFGLRTYRHRFFETGGWAMEQPHHTEHTQRTVKMGRPLKEGDFYHAVGNFTNVDYVRRDMNAPWMTRDGLRECIPPAYTQFIGEQLMRAL